MINMESDMLKEIREIVAQGWCDEPNRNKEMDSELANAISNRIYNYCVRWQNVSSGWQKVSENLEADYYNMGNSRDLWREIACKESQNSSYYKGILEKISKMFGGKAAYTSDDGSVQQDVLITKLPGLVEKMIGYLDLPRLQKF